MGGNVSRENRSRDHCRDRRSNDERFNRLGAALEHHERFPEGTNIEFVSVESPEAAVATLDPGPARQAAGEGAVDMFGIDIGW